MFVSIGTGIGSGIVIDGRLHRGASGAAGEIGYMVIDHTWSGSTTYDFGCFESMAAAGAIAAMAAEALGVDDALPEDLFRAAGSGHRAAGQAVKAIADRIAAAFSCIAALIDPQAIVIGGGISGAGEVLLEPVRERLAQLSPFAPELRASRLGTDAGLVGAAVLGIEEIKERALQSI
ncbi:MAG: N-acetylmannosamine kinase [Firmicutes bacterium ADurb.Bin506]|nr:MAG: N-acetylmannosamine kinase [Firmicutes bacterium ADurb.Bin506]